jgi:hypothetical protein
MGFRADINAERLGTGGTWPVDFDGTVRGTNNAYIMAERGEFLGECSGHVREASHFHKRFYFRSDKEDSQRAHVREQRNLAVVAE